MRKSTDISRPSVSRRLHNACAASVHSAPFPFALTSATAGFLPRGSLRYFVCHVGRRTSCSFHGWLAGLVSRDLAHRPRDIAPPFLHLSSLITIVPSRVLVKFGPKKISGAYGPGFLTSSEYRFIFMYGILLGT